MSVQQKLAWATNRRCHQAANRAQRAQVVKRRRRTNRPPLAPAPALALERRDFLAVIGQSLLLCHANLVAGGAGRFQSEVT